ncbi:MAG: hypothetical protein R3B84_21730 [Zavarzinella sp.]
MGLLGKLLILFNLLAAGAFGYFALENWKVRQELSYVAFRNEVVMQGIPLEAAAGATVPEGYKPFQMQLNEGVFIETVKEDTLKKIIPPGDDVFGGDFVADQTEEMTRLKKKVNDAIAALADDAAKRNRTRVLLNNLARTGLERDGVAALFDMLDPRRRDYARVDLAGVAQLPAQTEALKLLAKIQQLGDPMAIADVATRNTQILQLRKEIELYVYGQAPSAVAIGDAQAASTIQQEVAKVRTKLNQNAAIGAGDKAAIVALATVDAEIFANIVDLLVNPLSNLQQIEGARVSVEKYLTGLAVTDSEQAALKTATQLVMIANDDTSLVKKVDECAAALLNQKFEEGILPARTKEAKKGYPQGEKARRIAHVLYHIDADRHLFIDPANPVTTARKAWHSRVATIVGLPTYVVVAEAQASEYEAAAQRQLKLLAQEEAQFLSQYVGLVQQSRELDSKLQIAEASLARQQAITKENNNLLQERITERDKLRDDLVNAKADAKKTLEDLAVVQQQLFDAQKNLRDLRESVLSLEKELRRMESNN